VLELFDEHHGFRIRELAKTLPLCESERSARAAKVVVAGGLEECSKLLDLLRRCRGADLLSECHGWQSDRPSVQCDVSAECLLYGAGRTASRTVRISSP